MIYESLNKLDDYQILNLLHRLLWIVNPLNPQTIARYRAVREEVKSRGMIE
jgi:hypothetical protein